MMKPISFSLALKYLVFSASCWILLIPPLKQKHHQMYMLEDHFPDHTHCLEGRAGGALKAIWACAPPSGPYQPALWTGSPAAWLHRQMVCCVLTPVPTCYPNQALQIANRDYIFFFFYIKWAIVDGKWSIAGIILWDQQMSSKRVKKQKGSRGGSRRGNSERLPTGVRRQ